jgi:hypothetical protein
VTEIIFETIICYTQRVQKPVWLLSACILFCYHDIYICNLHIGVFIRCLDWVPDWGVVGKTAASCIN